MKYQLINKDIEGKSLLDIVYENRSLTKEQVEKLLNASSNEYKNPFTIFNMDNAVTLFKKIYKESLVVGILVDEDVSGRWIYKFSIIISMVS